MNQIEAFETNEEKALGSLLKKNAMESPSLNFTARVMAEVEKASVKVVNVPIISKKIWTFISVLSHQYLFMLFLQERRIQPLLKLLTEL